LAWLSPYSGASLGNSTRVASITPEGAVVPTTTTKVPPSQIVLELGDDGGYAIIARAFFRAITQPAAGS